MAFLTAVLGVEKNGVRVDPRQADGTYRPVILELGSTFSATATVGADGTVRVTIDMDEAGEPTVAAIEFAEPDALKVVLQTSVGGETRDLLTFDPNDSTITIGSDVAIGGVTLATADVGAINLSVGGLDAAVNMNATDGLRVYTGSTLRFQIPDAAVPAFTQTYSTTATTVPTPPASTTGIDNAQGATPYAQVTELEALRVQVVALTGLINTVIDQLQAMKRAT